jgi:putative hydrolase of the HAD superfamily
MIDTGANVRYQAVIFDLFGTLIPNFSEDEYECVLAEMAAVLEAPAAEFAQAWKQDIVPRMTGCFGGEKSNIAHVCAKICWHPSAAQIAQAVRIRRAFTARCFVPKSEAVATLAALRQMGCRTGLITDCTAEVPALWPKSPLAAHIDAAIFSCVAGIKKPDARIYQLCCEQLEVQPQACLYVGDGSSNELAGAVQVGMTAVMIRDGQGEEPILLPRISKYDWQGEMVDSLAKVIDLIDR